jgi:Domain of unknown function (DUF4157)
MAEAATLQRKPVTAPPPQVRALVPRHVIQRKSAAMPAYLQRSIRVSQAHDPAECEADSTARAVMTQAAPSTISTTGPALQRAATQPAPAATAPPAGDGSGVPLPARVRSFMEPRFRTDFSGVRIHTGSRAEAMNRAVSARAFATGSHIYFGKGEYQPDTPQGLELIAHELTHTIQQGAALQRKEAGPVVAQSAPIGVQRLGLSDALDYFADKANLIPGFRMFTIVLGTNPVNMRSVDRSAANILRALVELVPGGALITRALDAHGAFERAGAWIEGQFRSLGMAASSIRQAIDRFLDSLSWSDIFDLGGVWDRAKRILSEPVDRLIAFGRGLVDGIVRLIKDAILMPLARLAANTRGWDLLCAVLGRNPITGETVPRNATTLVGGFMKFIGQEDVWKRIQESNAIARVWAWFQGAMAQVTALVASFPDRMLTAFQALELADFLLLPRAIGKMLLAMGSFAVDFLSWGGNAVWKLLEIVIQVVSPSAWDYIKRTGAALRSILRDPLPFVRNLARAAKAGFEGFGNRFKTHLMEGIITWLTGELPGVYIPQALTLGEVAKLAFSILGLTWANIRGKLVRAIGPTAVSVLETTFDIVVTLVRDGPAAAWEKIKEQLANLKDMVIGGITDFLTEMAARATAKLVSLFVPGLGFISALVSIYDMIMVFVDRIRTIMEVVRNFIDSITAIAAGNISAAAAKVENVLKRLLGLAITFLAGFLGLGRVGARIRAIIDRVRQPIDRALDWLVNWIVTAARRLGRAVVSGARNVASGVMQWWTARQAFTARDGTAHSLYIQGSSTNGRLTVSTIPTPVEEFLRLVAPIVAGSTDARAKGDLSSAQALHENQIKPVIRQLNARGNDAPDPTIVDQLNRNLISLSALLASLIPHDPRSSAPTTIGSLPVRVGVSLIKIRSSNQIAVVDSLLNYQVNGVSDQLVRWRILSPRGKSPATGVRLTTFVAEWNREYSEYIEDPRQLYLGATPDKSGDVGSQVKERMAAQGKYNPITRMVTYNRDARGGPLSAGATGTEVHEQYCDMGHLIDAVVWWNSNGRLTFPQSPAVRAFMTNSRNYELEPSGPNRARGAALGGSGVRYLPPVG